MNNDLQRQAGYSRYAEEQIEDSSATLAESKGTTPSTTLGDKVTPLREKVTSLGDKGTTLGEKVASLKNQLPELLQKLPASLFTLEVGNSFDLEHRAKQGISLQRATSTDFVRIAVGALSGAMLGQGLLASGTVYLVNWFLGSLASLLPLEVVEYLLGRHVLLQDVDFIERILIDALEVINPALGLFFYFFYWVTIPTQLLVFADVRSLDQVQLRLDLAVSFD